MPNIFRTLYCAGHVGPFSLYPTAGYAIVVATAREKLAMPKWRNYIPVQTPGDPDDSALSSLFTLIAERGRAILLFRDHAGFKAWLRTLSEVLE